MEKLCYNEFSVYYEKNQAKSALQYIHLIRKYPTLLVSNLPKRITLSKPVIGYVRVKNIDDFMIREVRKIMRKKSMIQEEDEAAFLFQILIEAYDEDRDFNRQTVFDMDTILCLCGLKYYKSAEEYYDYLKNPTEKKKIEIADSLREKHREELFNSLLDTFKESGEKIEKNFVHLVADFIRKKTNSMDTFIKKYPKSRTPFTPLSKEQLVELFKEFLIEIDSTEDLNQIFEEGITNGTIQFKKSSETEEDNSSEVKSKGILITYLNGNTHDLKILAHEFGHYIAIIKKNEPKYYLNEFLSIFLELEAIDFLERNGLDQKETEALRTIREIKLLEIYTGITELYVLIDAKKKDKPIVAQDLFRIMNGYYEQNEEEFTLKDAESLMDDYTIDLVQEGSSLFDRPVYLIGYYYAKLLQQEPNRFQKFLSILAHLKEYDMERLDQELKGDAKVFTKNENECDIMG